MPRLNFGNTSKIVRWIRTEKPGVVKQFGELIARRLADLGKDADQFAPYPWDGQEPGNVNVTDWRRCVENAEGDEQIEIIGRWKATIDDHFGTHAHPANVPTADSPPVVECPLQEVCERQTTAREPDATKDSTIRAAHIMGLYTVAASSLVVGVSMILARWHVTGSVIAGAGLSLILLTWLWSSQRR